MPITTKAEAEALTVAELKTELEGRGLPTEGLKQAVMLETLLTHLDSAANGEPAAAPVEGAEEPKKDDAAPAETEAQADADPEVTEVAAPDAAPAADATATPAAEEDAAAPTRALDEVSGDTEEPDSKKAKAVAPEETAQPAKTVETATEAPSSEPVAAPVAE